MGVQLLYDHHHNYCDWPERVNCGSRPICDENNENCHEQKATSTPHHETTTKHHDVTTTKQDEVTTTKHDEVTTTKHSDEFECPDQWGYFSDPENCIKYYVCQAGVPTRMTCQTGTFCTLIWESYLR